MSQRNGVPAPGDSGKKYYRNGTSDWWKDRKVKTTMDMTNKYAEVPAGTVCIVVEKHFGLTLKQLPCARCGVSIILSRVKPEYVEFV